ncbi:MAG: helix-turn-helix domain-containing protein [Myxococcales bacterium]|nr:helix-turn-helix domain-containing protein [Myxococcales bacterium]
MNDPTLGTGGGSGKDKQASFPLSAIGIRRGRKPGPKGPRSYDRRLAEPAKRLQASGHSIRQIAGKLGRTRSTVHRMLR